MFIYWQNYFKPVTALKTLAFQRAGQQTSLEHYCSIIQNLLFEADRFSGLWSHKHVLLPWQFQGGLHLTKEMSLVCFFVWTNKNVITSWNLNFEFPGYKIVLSWVNFRLIRLASVSCSLVEIRKREKRTCICRPFSNVLQKKEMLIEVKWIPNALRNFV